MNRFPVENIDKVNSSVQTDKLATARNIKLTGDVTGSASFNGTAEASISVTVNDDSHNHVISNIDNLQSTLDNVNNTLGSFRDLRARANNPITTTTDDTTAKWVELGPGVYWFSELKLIDQPQQYGFLINYVYGSDIFQIWSSQANGPVRYRQGNASGWGNTWQNSATWADNCNWANGADASNVASTLAIAGRRVYFEWSGQGGQPDWVWGGTESTLANDRYYVYNPSNFNVNYANSAGRAFPKKTDGGDLNMTWYDHGGHPAYLWGGDDGTNMYVFPPSRLSVNYANSAGWASSAGNGGVTSVNGNTGAVTVDWVSNASKGHITPNVAVSAIGGDSGGNWTLPSGGTWRTLYWVSNNTQATSGDYAGGTTLRNARMGIAIRVS